jgi:hypothetical protein
MTKSIRTGVIVAAMSLALGGAAYAQGVSVDTQTRGAGAVNVGPGGAKGSVSGTNRTRGQIRAPGAGIDTRGQTTGQGSVGVGGGGIGGNVGAGDKGGAGVRIGR